MEITLFCGEFVQYPFPSIALGLLTLSWLFGKGRRIFEESEECLGVVDHLGNLLAKHANDFSETLVKKCSYAFYSKGSTSSSNSTSWAGSSSARLLGPSP